MGFNSMIKKAQGIVRLFLLYFLHFHFQWWTFFFQGSLDFTTVLRALFGRAYHPSTLYCLACSGDNYNHNHHQHHDDHHWWYQHLNQHKDNNHFIYLVEGVGQASTPPGIMLGVYYLWDFFGICLGYVWDIFGISLGFLWDIFGISFGYIWDIFGI